MLSLLVSRRQTEQLGQSKWTEYKGISFEIWLAQDGDLQVLLGESHLAPEPVLFIAGSYDEVYRKRFANIGMAFVMKKSAVR